MKLLFLYVPFQLLLGVILGILFPCTQIHLIWFSLFVAFVMFIFLWQYAVKFSWGSNLMFLSVVLFGVQLGWFSQVCQGVFLTGDHYKEHSNKNIQVQFTVTKDLKTTSFNHRFYADINSVNDTVCNGKVLIEVSRHQYQKKSIQVGDVLICKTNITPIDPPFSPYVFNYRKYLAHQNIKGKIKLKNSCVKIGERKHLFFRRYKIRNTVVSKLQKSPLSPAAISLIKAMILGYKQDFSEEIRTAFIHAGVAHIIAISGMHIGVLYLVLLFIFGFVKKIKHGKFIYVLLVLLFLWGFAIFSGLSSSVVRAVTMFSFFTLAKLNANKTLSFEAIVCSMLFLLLLNPNFLYDVGFQLSYMAVISIVMFYPLASKKMAVKNKAVTYVLNILLISLIAQLGVLPLSVYYFHQFPLQFLVANFFAISLLPIVLYGGILVLINILSTLNCLSIYALYNYFISQYLGVIQYLSSFEQLILKDLYFSKVLVFCYCLVLCCVWHLIYKFSLKRLCVFMGVILFCELLLLGEVYLKQNQSALLMCSNYKQHFITLKSSNSIAVIGKKSLSHQDSLLLKPYKIKKGIKKLSALPQDVFYFKKTMYMLVDKNKPYHQLHQKGMVLILSNNPKINLERLVKKLVPKQIVVLKNNYKSNQLKWKETCKKLKVSFYSLQEQGAYQVIHQKFPLNSFSNVTQSLFK